MSKVVSLSYFRDFQLTNYIAVVFHLFLFAESKAKEDIMRELDIPTRLVTP